MSVSRIDQLRELILKPNEDRLENLGDRIESMDRRTADIAEVLPESISDSYSRDTRLIAALRRPLKQCISESVRDEPDEYAAVLFPVMGPAIRRSITETLRTWTAQFSEVIEQSFSPRGLRWRLQAWRAGVPFGQYVIQQTLVYRVEDIYLIHSQSGLLISHVTQNVADLKDEDAVSAMFTAIQSFVNDSFARGNSERLSTAELDDLTLWAEHGPNTTIVAVIRGVAPIELRSRLETAIEQIERFNRRSLEDYQGDRATIGDVEPGLEACLLAATRTDKEEANRPKAAIVVLSAIVLSIAAWIAYGFWMDSKASAVADALRTTPGIIITATERDGGTIQLSGLRDRLAEDPSEIARAAGWTGDIVADLRPFLSLDDPLVLTRASAVLDPPTSVSLGVIDGTLVLTGTATLSWIEQANASWPGIVGIDRIDVSQLSIDADALLAPIRTTLGTPQTVDLRIDGSTVVATGEASRAWLDSVADNLLPAPILSVDTAGVTATEARIMATLADQIGQTTIAFERGGAVITAASLADIEQTAAVLASYGENAARLQQMPQLTITGHSDASGSEQFNGALEVSRAGAVESALIDRGVPPAWLTARGQPVSGLNGLRETVVTLQLDAIPPATGFSTD